MEFLELAKKRYSCRKFSDKPVEPEKIEKILQAAISAPTAKNVQPFKIWVIQSQNALEKARSATACHFNAPVILAIGGTCENAFVRPFDNRNYQDVDASIVATHIMLEVEDLGLGTTWVGFFDAPKFQELFPEMKDYDLIALFPIGYPAEDAKPAERHFIRKEKSELVNYL